MSVYIGELLIVGRTEKWRFRYSAHLFADTVEELHRFALRIGLRREWFQNHPRLPHYDVTANKRREAIAKGAVPVDRNEEVKFYKDLSKGKA